MVNNESNRQIVEHATHLARALQAIPALGFECGSIPLLINPFSVAQAASGREAQR